MTVAETTATAKAITAQVVYLTSTAALGDGKDEAVQKKILADQGFSCDKLVICQQVHGRRVSWVTMGSEKYFPVTDGLITDLEDVPLGIFTADCLPLFLSHENQGIVGIVHAGWRGVAQKVGVSAILALRKRLGEDCSALTAHIGPHIRSCCYVVGDDVAAFFSRECSIGLKKKKFLNLENAMRIQLQDCGVPPKNISADARCTFCGKDFFSYRRDKTAMRMFSFIARRKRG